MAKLLDRRNLPARTKPLPDMRPPVREFAPANDGDPREVDSFNQMIQKLRDQGSAFEPARTRNALLLDTNVVSILFNKNQSET